MPNPLTYIGSYLGSGMILSNVSELISGIDEIRDLIIWLLVIFFSFSFTFSSFYFLLGNDNRFRVVCFLKINFYNLQLDATMLKYPLLEI